MIPDFLGILKYVFGYKSRREKLLSSIIEDMERMTKREREHYEIRMTEERELCKIQLKERDEKIKLLMDDKIQKDNQIGQIDAKLEFIIDRMKIQ